MQSNITFLKDYITSDESLQFNKAVNTLLEYLSASKTSLNTIGKLNHIADALSIEGLLLNVVHRDGIYRIQFKNPDVKKCLFDGGSILELYTFQQERKKSDHCLVGGTSIGTEACILRAGFCSMEIRW